MFLENNITPHGFSFLNKKNLKLSYILNTHHHFAHIGGNTELKKLYEDIKLK